MYEEHLAGFIFYIQSSVAPPTNHTTQSHMSVPVEHLSSYFHVNNTIAGNCDVAMVNVDSLPSVSPAVDINKDATSLAECFSSRSPLFSTLYLFSEGHWQ